MVKNNFTISLCPHCKEKKEELNEWEKIAQKISDILGAEVSVNILENFDESKLNEKECQIYYANPDHSIKLLRNDYIILGKLKGQKESLCVITSKSYSKDKEIIRVVLINQPYFLIPLLFYKREYKKFHLIFVQSYEEVVNHIRENKADIGFIYVRLSEELKNDKKINFSEELCFPIAHYILINPSLERFKEKLLSIEEFERISSQEIETLKFTYSHLEILLRDWAYHDISEALVKSPNLGVIIYHEKILFYNEYAKNLLGYSDEELYTIDSIEIVYIEDRDIIKKNKERRLGGEKFYATYDIRFQRKDGSIIFVECIANTILFRGLYAGFVIFYDITERKYAEKAKEMLMEINKIITQSLTEEEIYIGICTSLAEKLNFNLAWIGMIDYENKRIVKKYSYGDDRGLFDVFDYRIQFDDIISSGALLSGEITINADTRDYAKVVHCAIELLKRDFLSTCTIPILKSGKVFSLLKIYSKIPKFFNDTIIDVLKEIQYDISFALERVERLRHNIIISEALKNSDTWILVTDENGNIVYVNEAVERISGYSKEELIGQNPRIFKSGLNPPEFYKNMWDTILSGRIFNAITPNRKKSGEIFHADLKIIPVKLPGNILRFVAVAKDVTHELILSERVHKLQNFDALTELFNMNGFLDEVSKKLSNIKGFGLLILIDIYDMTSINKIYSINIGDELLKQFATQLKNIFQETNIIARISADTFGVFIPAEVPEEIYRAYSKILELNNSFFEIENKKITVSINGAISIFPKDGNNFKSLYERADITLQSAKKKGAGVIQFFDPELEKQTENVWEVFTLIKRALENNLFVFYYQPYFYTDSLKFAGCEALVRIIDENGKLYPPNVFIDYLESSHYLRSFENWAIKEIIEKIEKWKINISLNISGRTFINPFFQTIIAGIPKGVREKLIIEITERIFIENTDYTMQILKNIKSMESPPQIAIDDFGTGYSSIVYLKDLPIDIIKIDRIFIRDMIKDKKSLAIVQTIIELVKRLEKKTLAEGVETKEQYEILKEIGCDFVQGYLFSKPLPERDFKSLL